MNLTLPLTAAEEAKLLAKAQAEGVSPELLVRHAIEPIIAAVPEDHLNKPKKSMLGMLAKYGPAPSAEEIDENRKDMFANFGRDDIA
jgi:hypothetical protein